MVGVSIAKQEEVRKHAAKWGAVYTGHRETKGGYIFLLTKPDRDDRFVTLGSLGRTTNPFGRLTLHEQEAKVRKHAEALGATYAGEFKKKSH